MRRELWDDVDGGLAEGDGVDQRVRVHLDSSLFRSTRVAAHTYKHYVHHMRPRRSPALFSANRFPFLARLGLVVLSLPTRIWMHAPLELSPPNSTLIYLGPGLALMLLLPPFRLHHRSTLEAHRHSPTLGAFP
jgi:hypothetical protein